MELDHYEVVPHHVAEDIIAAKAKDDKEESAE